MNEDAYNEALYLVLVAVAGGYEGQSKDKQTQE